MADKVANGILFKIKGIANTLISNKKPWMIVDIFDLAPALLFAEVLTTTEVMGKPPSNELIKLPIPCAFNSTLVSVYLF